MSLGSGVVPAHLIGPASGGVLSHAMKMPSPGDPDDGIKDATKGSEVKVNPTGELLRKIAKAAEKGDEKLAKAIVDEVFQKTVGDDWFQPVSGVVAKTKSNIAYLTGYLPVDLANVALKVFDVEHPYFGKHIPEDQDELILVGRNIGQDYKAAQLRREEADKKMKLLKAGVHLPGAEEEVTSGHAKEVLEKLREMKKAAEKAKMVKEVKESSEAIDKLAKEYAEKLNEAEW